MLTIALGLLSGALGTLFYQLITWETYRKDSVAYAQGIPAQFDDSISQLVQQTGQKINEMITAFKFFPSFLALGYISYAINHWRTFQTMCYSIQGILNTTALKVGSSLTRPEDIACKQLSFRVYRYLQVIHLLIYKKRNRWYQLLKMEDFITLGLLTEDEIKVLVPADNKMHEVVVSWVVRLIVAGNENGLLCLGQRAFDPCDIRGKLGSFNDHFAVGQPNMWAALMKLVCDLLVLMFIAGSAFGSFLYKLGPMQFYVVIFSVLLALPWLCALRLLTLLEDPFNSHHDMFNVDSMVASTDRTTFLNLRCGW